MKIKRIMVLLIIGVIAVNVFNTKTFAVTSNELSQEQLLAIEEFINDKENNGIIRSIYSSVDEMDVGLAIRELGISSSRNDISTEEKAWIQENIGNQTDIFVNRRDEVEQWYNRITGKELKNTVERMKASSTGWEYSEDYDSFYKMHGDTDYLAIKAVKGVVDENGNYVVEYLLDRYIYTNDNSEYFHSLAITLKKQGTSYQVISNQKVEDTILNTETNENNDTSNEQNSNNDANIDNENTEKKKDDTVASKPIPQTGTSIVPIIAVVLITGIAAFFLIKSKLLYK